MQSVALHGVNVTVSRARRYAARGANVCRLHGGDSPQCKAAARRRLDQAADVLVQRLLNFALDDDASDNVALQAIIATLDRAGIVKPAQLDVAIGPRPFEQIFDDISGGSRAESRARRGMPDDGLDEWHIPALEAASGAGEGSEIEIVDAEVIDPEPKRTAPPSSSNAARASHAGRTTYGSVTASGHDRRESHGHDRPLGEMVVRTQEVPNRVFVMKRGSAWVDTVSWLSLGTGLGP